MKIDTVETVPLLDWSDLNEVERDFFDWMDNPTEADGTFFRYRDRIFAIGEFMLTTNEALLSHGYIGIHTDTFFSATVCKMPDYMNDEITVAFVMSGDED